MFRTLDHQADVDEAEHYADHDLTDRDFDPDCPWCLDRANVAWLDGETLPAAALPVLGLAL